MADAVLMRKPVATANVRAAWPASQGSGIVIGIVDDGVQYVHPDLDPNYLASASYDFNSGDSDPQPFATAPHGTAVAGIAAARGDNTIGVAGVAPLASLAALRLTAVASSDAVQAAAFGHQPNVIHILNNSWGPLDNGKTILGPGPLAKAALASAATSGRNGKGQIVVWRAGDGRLSSDDCNFNGYANSRFGMAVGALNDLGDLASYSEGCSALMLVAPSSGGSRSVTTTDLIGTAGLDSGDYTSGFTGTSAAAPAVSGAAALMLARNPNLTWRDVQHILRRTAVRINPTDPAWTSGDFPHNERLGFGLLDAEAAAAMAGTWVNVPAEEALTPPTRTLNWAIPDINATGISDTITISAAEANFVIEHVEVEFDATHSWRGDLQISLTSPAGVVSRLAPIRPSDNTDHIANWTFGSVRHWDETAAGVWTLNVADRRFQDTGTWKSWKLRIYGYHTAVSAPGSFGMSSPANGATGQSLSPTLSWGASSGAASYEYCYDTSNNGVCNASWVSTGGSTSVALSGLAVGTSYYWHVRANSAGGTTYAGGNPATFWAFSTVAAPGAFSHSSPANGATGQAVNPTLSWGASSGATSYEYCYDTTNNNACSGWTSTGANTSVALSGLANNTTYYWHARATNAGGATYAAGSATAFRSFTTVVAAHCAIRNSSPANGATGQAVNPTLSWGASSGATSCEYCYDSTNDSACSGWTSTGANTSVALGGLANNTTYYWHARANNAGGATYAAGSATAFRSFTTVVAAPGAFSHSSPANGATGQAVNATLSWGTSSGAVSYEFCIDAIDDNACTVWYSTGSVTALPLSGLANNTTYYWQVRATNPGGTTYA
jgi:subtilisin-like proprotein convertase family protein